jgi:hypothetical protein
MLTLSLLVPLVCCSIPLALSLPKAAEDDAVMI